MEEFRLAVEEFGPSDLGFVENKFTWCNNKHGKAFTNERLDRGFGNSFWNDMFINIVICILPAQISNHNPLLIFMDNNSISYSRRDKPFRYEAY